MRRDPHVRFGGRSEETGGARDPYRASLRPYYNLLEGSFELLLVNARHIKTVPGRKTDVRDCEWIADLLRHGLLRASFVPDREQRELRDLTRYRLALVRERSSETNRLAKDARRREHQTGVGRDRHPGQVGPGDPDRIGRRCNRPVSPGRPGAWTDAEQDLRPR